eukprot:6210614-Pleurochrysis_carterae.AAC.4
MNNSLFSNFKQNVCILFRSLQRLVQASSDEEEDPEDAESDFEPEDDEEEEEESDDDDDAYADSDDSGSGEESLDSDESEGKDWEELDKEAEKSDKKRARCAQARIHAPDRVPERMHPCPRARARAIISYTSSGSGYLLSPVDAHVYVPASCFDKQSICHPVRAGQYGAVAPQISRAISKRLTPVDVSHMNRCLHSFILHRTCREPES